MKKVSLYVPQNHFYQLGAFQQSAPPTRFGSAICNVADSNNRLQEGRDLLGYLYARAAIGEEIEGNLLERLTNANSIVRHTRAKLACADAIGQNTSFSVQTLGRRLYFLRARLGIDASEREPRFCAVDSAKADFMRVGSCDEMASHTSCNYVLRFLKEDETVAVARSFRLDHAWGEIHADDAPVVIMDAWSIGPAVLKEDARYRDAPADFAEAYDASTQKDIAHLMRSAAKTLEQKKETNIRRFTRFWAHKDNALLASYPTRRRELVFSDEFMEKASDDAHSSDLSRHLRAIRILRNLGLTTQDAVQYRKVVLQSYQNRLLGNAME